MSTGKDVEKETIPSTAGKGVYWSSHLDGYLTISTKAKHMQTSPHRIPFLAIYEIETCTYVPQNTGT